MQAPSRCPMLRRVVAGASPAAAAAAAAADVPRPQVEAAAAEGDGGSGDVYARVAHVYRIEGLGTLTLEGALPGEQVQTVAESATCL
jgi:hypothetical protein